MENGLTKNCNEILNELEKEGFNIDNVEFFENSLVIKNVDEENSKLIYAILKDLNYNVDEATAPNNISIFDYYKEDQEVHLFIKVYDD
jgi:hypothetical protein